MKQIVRTGHRCLVMLLTFALTAFLLAALLAASAKIPRSRIEQQMRRSAEYLCEGKLFGERISGISGSKIDRYADAVLLGIAWQYDEKNPIHSMIESAYYRDPYENANSTLLIAVTDHLPANQEYLRYWHGSIAILRPLLMWFSIREIYWMNGILLAVLTVCFMVRLIRRRAWVPLVGTAAALIGVSCWFIPLSLEYTWVFLILLVQLHLVIDRRFPRSFFQRALFFMISGIVTNYLDFLTTELITLLIPLLLILWKDQEDGILISVRDLVGLMAAWGAGYAGMWALKWLLAAWILGADLGSSVRFHIWVRSAAIASDHSLGNRMEGVFRNIQCLFPLEYGETGRLAAGAAGLLVLYIGYVYHRTDIRFGYILRCGAIGLIPLLRYFALGNHSYMP